MRDLGGILLLILTLLGAVKGRGLPEATPYIILVVSATLLIYRGFYIKSKLSFVYTATMWASLVWVFGITIEKSWGSSLVMLIPYTLLLILTPIVAYLHQRIYRRFNPTSTRGLEIEPVEGTPSFLESIKKLFTKREQKQEELQPIMFDLGSEVRYKNR